jgi:hypothetical protein
LNSGDIELNHGLTSCRPQVADVQNPGALGAAVLLVLPMSAPVG